MVKALWWQGVPLRAYPVATERRRRRSKREPKATCASSASAARH